MHNPTEPSLMRELAQALSHAERRVVGELARSFADEGCTVPEWRILLLLADGRGHTMSDVAEFALMPAPSLTRLIDRMVTDGLVHRRPDACDRRRITVHLTRRGRGLYRRLDDRLQRDEEAMLGADRADVERLLSLLGGLVERPR